MLRRLRIRNFKGWRDTGELRLAPLTVLFGPNSSGKSSLLQFLLMLRQTAESPDRRRVLHPGDRTTPVELGTYGDLVFEHRQENKIEFEIDWDLSQSPGSDPIDADIDSFALPQFGERMRFEASIDSRRKFTRQYVDFFRYSGVGQMRSR